MPISGKRVIHKKVVPALKTVTVYLRKLLRSSYKYMQGIVGGRHKMFLEYQRQCSNPTTKGKISHRR
jgi:hypothetical protein